MPKSESKKLRWIYEHYDGATGFDKICKVDFSINLISSLAVRCCHAQTKQSCLNLRVTVCRMHMGAWMDPELFSRGKKGNATRQKPQN